MPQPRSDLVARINKQRARERARSDRPPMFQRSGMHPLDLGAMVTAPIPGVGDLVGGAADLRAIREDPSAANIGLGLAGLIPGIPSLRAARSIVGEGGGGVTSILKRIAGKNKKLANMTQGEKNVLRRLTDMDITNAFKRGEIDQSEALALRKRKELIDEQDELSRAARETEVRQATPEEEEEFKRLFGRSEAEQAKEGLRPVEKLSRLERELGARYQPPRPPRGSKPRGTR